MQGFTLQKICAKGWGVWCLTGCPEPEASVVAFCGLSAALGPWLEVPQWLGYGCRSSCRMPSPQNSSAGCRKIQRFISPDRPPRCPNGGGGAKTFNYSCLSGVPEDAQTRGLLFCADPMNSPLLFPPQMENKRHGGTSRFAAGLAAFPAAVIGE